MLNRSECRNILYILVLSNQNSSCLTDFFSWMKFVMHCSYRCREYVYSVAAYQKYINRSGGLIIFSPSEKIINPPDRVRYFWYTQHYILILFIPQRLICWVVSNSDKHEFSSIWIDWLIEQCFTLLLTVFQSHHGYSSHYSLVSPVLGWALTKKTKDPVRLEHRTPRLRVKHFTAEPRGTLAVYENGLAVVMR